MQVNKIKTLLEGDKFSGTYALTNAEVKQTKNGKSFLSCILVDKTGRVDAKVWGYDDKSPRSGTVWSIDGEFSPFNGTSQVIVRRFAKVPDESIDKGMFIESLTRSEMDFYLDEANSLLSQINDDKLREFTRFTIFDYYSDFITSPGAQFNHHARIGGLLQHSVMVTKLAFAMANGYRGTPTFETINTDLVIAGGLLHDLGKIGEYTTESSIIECSVEGTLMTHYDTNPAYLMEAWLAHKKSISREILTFLFHIQTTHHGKEYSERPPSSVSAALVASADRADSFIEAGQDLLKQGVQENGFTRESRRVIGNKFYDERILVQ
ncbi:MAG: HDIG domain-containing protein [Nitrososphaera sp.]|nr:HDIG domain-containing protein [Nitrososphaera sp.]